MPLNLDQLDELLSSHPHDFISTIHDNLTDWQHVLTESATESNDEVLLKIVRVLELLSSHSEDTSVKNHQIRILTLTCGNDKFLQSLKNTIVKWSLNPKKTSRLQQLISSLYPFISEVLQVLPLLGTDFLSSLVFAVIGVLASGPETDELGKYVELQTKIVEISKTFEVVEKKKTDEFDGVHETLLDASEPPEDFRGIPIVPTLDELLGDRFPFLRPNKVRGAYRDADHYLDVQFRLLREDFVRPLRRGVEQFVKYKHDFTTRKKTDRQQDSGVRVYSDITFYRVQQMKDSPPHYLFNLPRNLVKGVNWSKSKKLLSGCLVMLTSDFCKTGIFGVTCEPPRDNQGTSKSGDPRRNELARGILRLSIERGEEFVDSESSYVMLECEAYFESYKHNLRALQEITFFGGGSGVGRYVVGGCSDVGAPGYFGVEGDRKIVLARAKSGVTLEAPVHELDSWNSTLIQSVTGLDPDQYAAYKTALTSELSVIQGPPGTGKTHVGLQIVKTLLLNKRGKSEVTDGKRKWTPGVIPKAPILVLCYTNHALDQFLEHLLDHIEGLSIVRVGGQVKSEKLKELSLYSHRMRVKGRDGCLQRQKSNEWAAKCVVRDLENELKCLERDIAELERPSGVVKFSGLVVGRRLENVVPGELWGKFGLEWLGIRVDVFANRNFDVKEHVSVMFNVRGKGVVVGGNGITRGGVENGVREVVKDEAEPTQEEEHYDLDELLEQRVQDEKYEDVDDDSWVCVSRGPQSVYHDGSTVGECSTQLNAITQRLNQIVAACQTGKCTEQAYLSYENLEARAVVLSNMGSFLANIIGLRNENRLELPNLEGVFYKRNGEYVFKCGKRVPMRVRWGLYFRVVELALEMSVGMKREVEVGLVEAKKALVLAREALDGGILRGADVVGFTTTGAAKHRGVLVGAGADIVVVEEAAEILESHVITALTESCKQLILIGDHFQLRPKTSVYELETKYRMNVSLFERMILNGVACCTLKTQHRMRPQISNLIKGTIYEDLRDHQNVFKYPCVRGVKESLFFITHNEHEDTDSELLSKRNHFEATYLIGLCGYLLKQGYDSTQITILATYTGQMFLLKKLLPSSCAGVRVTCVDSYQGEENVIILLSLVRSNKRGDLGFVGRDNRICVALSRAKHGMFVVGDMECLGRSDTWKGINGKLVDGGMIGGALEVVCSRHGRVTKVGEVGGFDKLVGGGCDQICNAPLNCGHVCQKLCHALDQEHKDYKCKDKCTKTCEYDHPCKSQCWQECPKCNAPITRELGCGHKVKLNCHLDYTRIQCVIKVDKVLPCAHTKKLSCHVSPDTIKCSELVSKTLPCGHELELECHVDEYAIMCPVLVEKKLPCSHVAEVECHVLVTDVKCVVEETRELSCGHQKTLACYLFLGVVKCEEVVEITLMKCGHNISLKCHELVNEVKCQVRVVKTLGCGHEKELECHVSLSGVVCVVVVEKTLPCGHPRKLYCHQPVDDIRCNAMVAKELGCGHEKKLKCFRSRGNVQCTEMVDKVFGACGHRTTLSCHVEKTSTCKSNCSETLSCGHVCPKPCHALKVPGHDEYKCVKQCDRSCGYGHPCRMRHVCNLACLPCNEQVELTLRCGHVMKVTCREQTGTEPRCYFKVVKELPCGHSQLVACYVDEREHECGVRVEGCGVECERGHECTEEHACSEDCPPCSFKTPKILECGHGAMVACFEGGVEPKCTVVVEKVLGCSHVMGVECCVDVGGVRCREMVGVDCGVCGRNGLTQCGAKDPLGRCLNCVRVVKVRDEQRGRGGGQGRGGRGRGGNQRGGNQRGGANGRGRGGGGAQGSSRGTLRGVGGRGPGFGKGGDRGGGFTRGANRGGGGMGVVRGNPSRPSFLEQFKALK